jgi:hypothetical protein
MYKTYARERKIRFLGEERNKTYMTYDVVSTGDKNRILRLEHFNDMLLVRMSERCAA